MSLFCPGELGYLTWAVLLSSHSWESRTLVPGMNDALAFVSTTYYPSWEG